MGLGGISVWQLLIILAIVVVLFGTKRLGSIGSDLGSAVKGFRKAISDEDKEKLEAEDTDSSVKPESSKTKQDENAG